MRFWERVRIAMEEKTMSQTTFQIHPIGHVQAGFTLHIDEPYRPALKQIEKFSHVKVYWWADQHDNDEARSTLQCEPPYARGYTVGVFACCSPARPNPIATTTCFILDVDEEQGIIQLPWIDAFDGTAIIDLKPYVPVADRVRDWYGPEWLAPLPGCLEEGANIPEGFFGD